MKPSHALTRPAVAQVPRVVGSVQLSIIRLTLTSLVIGCILPVAGATGNNAAISPSALAPSRWQSRVDSLLNLANFSQTSQPPGDSPKPKDAEPNTLVTTSWAGMQSDFLYEPPDPHGAAGPVGIIQVVNVRIAYWDKTGRTIWGPVPLDGMFAGVGNSGFSFDPHALYDPDSGRFYVVLLETDDPNQRSFFNLAVSKSSNPRSSTANDWYFYRIENTRTVGTNAFWGDYPGFGFDARALYLTLNLYDFTSNNGDAVITVMDKNAFLNGNTNYAFIYTSGGPAGGFTLQPCTTLGTGNPGNVAYFAETPLLVNDGVRIWALSDPLGARTLTSTMVSTPDNGGFPGGAPQPGTAIPIDTLGIKTQGNAFWFNGTLWFCNTAGGATGKSLVYYYAIAANGYPGGTPSVAEVGFIDGGAGEWTYQPSIGANALGDIGLVYSQSSARRNPSIFATTRKAGAPGFDPPVLIKASPSYYFGGRWGDFASTTADPIDNNFWVTHEFARSSQIIDWGTWWAKVIPETATSLSVVTNYVFGGNGNGVIEFNECNDLALVLTNSGSLGATNVEATLSTTTPGVLIVQPKSTYTNLPVGAAATNNTLFKISTAPSFVCGLPIDCTLQIKSDQGTTATQFKLPSGSATNTLRFDNSTPTPIPDLGTIVSTVIVTNIDTALLNATVSLYITHTFDSDLVIALVSPGGRTNILSSRNGINGDNYGLNCSPDSLRTTFDDSAANSIVAGTPPFLGAYRPQQPLANFSGTYGTNVNGPWRLLIADTAQFDVGTLQCWSLFLTAAACTNGGGECPGSDMAISMVSAPEPAIVGNNLTYTIYVTNNGPSAALNVSVGQVLPTSVIFVSGSSSQGAVVHNNGVVTANLGPMSARGVATISVVVLPAVAGVFSSTASVTSDQADFNPANNNVTIISHVNPPTADLSVGLLAAPNSLIVGGNVLYTVSVTNNGPSSASAIVVTNSYAAGLLLRSATISQGSLYITNGNTVICSFGSLAHGATATATVTATAASTGTLLSSARVFSTNPSEIDPNPNNDFVTVPVAVGPAADLALGLVALPNPDIVTSNLTLITTVTNFGPSIASAVVVSEALPTALTNITITISPTNAFTLNGTNLSVNLGNMIPGAKATITVVGGTIKQGFLSCVAAANATETDPNLANNSGTVNVLVALPFVNIVAAGSSMTSPSTGYIDLGQTNTIQFRLQNIGNVANTNLVATLMTNASVAPVSGPQNYGILRPIGVPGGVPVSRPFGFIANGTNGGTVTAVLSLSDASNTNFTPVTFTFLLPLGSSFANTNLITIPDPNNMPTLDSGPAAPYPSMITVSGVTGQVARVTATIMNLTHSYPHDISALLVSPTGAKTLLLSHAGEFASVNAATLTFDDTAPAQLPASGGITSGSWQPSAYPPSPVFSNPAPPGPYTASMATFGGSNPNGTWSLYVYDDGTGDAGNIANGWSLGFSTVTPVNQLADVGLAGIASANPALVGDVLTYIFSVTNTGPNGATGVTFSNTLPASLVLLSASSSQGNAVTNGNTVLANLATLANGASATVTITTKPTVAAVGQITNSASVGAFEADLHTSDNRASVITAINFPSAALGLGITAAPTNAFVGSNLVYTINLTNNGPGNALSVSVSDTLPGGLTYVSATSQPGTVSYNSGTVTATMGDLSPNSTGSVTITARPQVAGLVTNSASALTLSSNTPPSAASVVTILAPGPILVPVGQALVFESFPPPNGVVDAGEQVTVSLSLANTGVLDTANLMATLLATNGITLPSGPANYGHLVHGGAPVSRNFNFTASPSAAGSVTAVLQLTDGANNLGTASFVFSLPSNNTFVNTNSIVIPDHGPGSPYPSIINVTGLTGYVTRAVATLSGLTHSFPADVNVLLVNPAGSRTLLMSHNGGAYSVTNVTLTFDDGAATALPNNARITTSTNRPSRFTPSVTFPTPAPAPPYSAALSALNNSSPNGVWSLYVLDDSGGDSGVIASGWSLTLSTINPVSALDDLAASMTVSPASVFIGGTLAYIINVTNLGPVTAPNVQVADTLPEGCTMVGAIHTAGTVSYTAGTVFWSIGDLALGGTASMTMTVAPSIPGTFLNVATVSGNVTDVNQANNSPQVFAQAVSPAPATLSGTVTNGFFLLTVNAEPGLNYMVQASTNLTSWVSLGIYTATNGTFTVPDNFSPASRSRYYRTVRQLP